MYVQIVINICFTEQDETVENGRTRQERQTMCSGLAKHDSDCSKSDGQSRVYEISGDTRESVNKANKLTQKLVDTCNDEYAKWLRTNRFSFQFRSKQGS